MSKHPAFEALSMVCVELERHDPNSSALHFARGVLACSSNLVSPIAAAVGKRERYRSHYTEQYPEMAAAYRAGDSLAEVAARFNCSVSVIRRALDVEGVPCRPKGPPIGGANKNANKVLCGRIDEIMRMRAEGATGEQIGRHLGITRERVRQIVVKAGKTLDYAVRPLNAAERKAVEDYRNGADLHRVAADLGVGVTTAKNLITRAGQSVRPSKKKMELQAGTLEKAQRIAADYRAGLTINAIAEKHGYANTPPIYRMLSIAGQPRLRQHQRRAA